MSSLPDGLAPAIARGVDTALDRSVALGFSRLGLAARRRLPTWPADPAPGALAGRTVAVTGASSGLGLSAATGMARLGAAVRLVVRDTEKGERVRRELLQQVPGTDAVVDRCDVADLDDVRRFARELTADLAERGDGGLDALVHNAGALPGERSESPQGHELTMAVHVLGPVLMTDLLAEPMAGRDARVVMITSGGMYGQRLRADDPEYLDLQKGYSGTTAYARSKRAQVELLPLLGARWEGSGIGVYATHPGWADTPGVVDALPGFHRVTKPVLRDAEGGADTTVWLTAVDLRPVSGELWHDRRARSAHLLRKTHSRPGDPERMYAWVCEQVGISPR